MRCPRIVTRLLTESTVGLSLNLLVFPFLTEIGAEANGSIYVKVVLQVHSERSCQQAAALRAAFFSSTLLSFCRRLLAIRQEK